MTFILILLLVAAWDAYGSVQWDEAADDKWENHINEAGRKGKPEAPIAGMIGSGKC